MHMAKAIQTITQHQSASCCPELHNTTNVTMAGRVMIRQKKSLARKAGHLIGQMLGPHSGIELQPTPTAVHKMTIRQQLTKRNPTKH